MRLWIFIHVVAVACCVAFSLADRGLLVSASFSDRAMPWAGGLIAAALLAWIACPLMTVVAVIRKQHATRHKFAALLAEAALSIAQMYALLPACM